MLRLLFIAYFVILLSSVETKAQYLSLKNLTEFQETKIDSVAFFLKPQGWYLYDRAPLSEAGISEVIFAHNQKNRSSADAWLTIIEYKNSNIIKYETDNPTFKDSIMNELIATDMNIVAEQAISQQRYKVYQNQWVTFMLIQEASSNQLGNHYLISIMNNEAYDKLYAKERRLFYQNDIENQNKQLFSGNYLVKTITECKAPIFKDESLSEIEVNLGIGEDLYIIKRVNSDAIQVWYKGKYGFISKDILKEFTYRL
ncbi:MAG: hypothetical protein LAT68_02795 [Cyclobacteriaceae bacterium]|nr:hypothetical protein [Cyclobacteriaceae bacterium]MCH8515233.1 hypothetical protein [Cyclobacteriaceae bacterium]